MDDLLADWGREEGRKFIIVSDDARFWNLPFNASLVPMAFCELQSLVRKNWEDGIKLTFRRTSRCFCRNIRFSLRTMWKGTGNWKQ